jgi:hypothetical protein
MQVLDEEYCNLIVERVALHHTCSALAAEAYDTTPNMLWQAAPLTYDTFICTYLLSDLKFLKLCHQKAY